MNKVVHKHDLIERAAFKETYDFILTHPHGPWLRPPSDHTADKDSTIDKVSDQQWQ